MRDQTPPLSLEHFAWIMVEYTLHRNPANGGPAISYGRLLEEHHLTIQQWAETSAYWTPRINDPTHPAAARYKTLLQEAVQAIGDKPGRGDAE